MISDGNTDEVFRRARLSIGIALIAFASIMGVGTARNHKAMKWHLVESILWTWFMTLPATGLIAYGLMRLLLALGAGA